ncbi:hypothetical protein SY83_01925 [Paenibacillus swuensis]|uniref:YqcI/YcgG family protein n=1 Tax=Paenibacillus swuensis TaxID=1178515 RepID=A0A172TES8_9BACL|nr:YqcI/YcgG family protein [Paenibacillus swuensis]ANE45293.1 hypothetical protein SY83_01925 [Paenibacillus swuensis]
MSNLYTKSWLDANLTERPLWQQDAFTQFGAMIADPDQSYPCVPGRQGFLTDQLRFGFAGDPRSESSTEEVAELLVQYGECSRETGKYASLVIFFDTPYELRADSTVEQYEELFWSFLNRLTQLDTKPWPEHISKDPSDPTWEFCYDGHPYFSFCATPAHIIRKSRSFSYFMMAFQPRWVFEHINDSTPFGRNMKKVIRSKLQAYDGIPVHPALKWYGQEDNQEWKQYFLRDDETSPSKCPYTAMKNKLKSLGLSFHK